MNKRELSKLKTRAAILNTTKELMVQNGVMKLTTNEIAKSLGIAHGSIFLHFGSREMLIFTVLDDALKEISAKVIARCGDLDTLEDLLEQYLTVIAESSDFLQVIYKELPYFPGGIQREVFALEALLRNMFYMKIEAVGIFEAKQIGLRLDGFFSTIVRYLTLNDLYAPKGNALVHKKDDLKQLFKILFREVFK